MNWGKCVCSCSWRKKLWKELALRGLQTGEAPADMYACTQAETQPYAAAAWQLATPTHLLT